MEKEEATSRAQIAFHEVSRFLISISTADFAPSRCTTSRTSMSFATDIAWHFSKYLPKPKSAKIFVCAHLDKHKSSKEEVFPTKIEENYAFGSLVSSGAFLTA